MMAQDKLGREFDVLKMIKANREVRLIRMATLSKFDQMLMRYQRLNIIETDDSSSAYEKQDHFQSLIQSKKPAMRIRALTHLKKVFDNFISQNRSLEER